MFSRAALLIALLVGTIPLVLVVNMGIVLLKKARFTQHKVNYFCATLCLAWILLSLHSTLKEIQFINSMMLSMTLPVRAIIFILLPSLFLGVFFTKNISKLSIVLVAMLATAVVTSKSQLTARMGNAKLFADDSPKSSDIWFNPKVKNNIYLVLSDGLASFRYLEDAGMEMQDFRNYLDENEFTLYNDTFANVHPTLLSMASMLNFQLVDKSNNELAREAIANPSELKTNLRSAGYDLEYIHMADYLLVRGCAANNCFPRINSITEAKVMGGRILGNRFKVGENWDKFVSPERMLTELENSILENENPTFRYIHHYSPGHTPHKSRNNCNEAEQLENYFERVGVEFDRLKKTVDTIIRNDRRAVIVVTGDHGPWISNNCSWRGIPENVSALRDRISAAITVRWPDSYDGKFDNDIFTTVNLLKYVLYSLNISEDAPPKLAREDLYVLNADGVPVRVTAKFKFD